MPSISRDQVAPYISLLLARTESSVGDKKHLADVLADVKAIAEAIDDGVTRELMAVGQPSTSGGITSGFLHYQEERKPTWFRDGAVDVLDRVNHVIVAVQAGQFLAFCSSSRPYQEEIARAIRNKPAQLKRVDEPLAATQTPPPVATSNSSTTWQHSGALA